MVAGVTPTTVNLKVGFVEVFHQPILATYSSIRRHENLVGIRCGTDSLRRFPLRFPRHGGERRTHLFGQGPHCGHIWC